MKRESTSTLDKPVLDEETFEQLLTAANILQQHYDRLLVKEPKADYVQTLADRAIAENVGPIHVVPPETVAPPVVSLERQPKAADLARLAYRYRTLGGTIVSNGRTVLEGCYSCGRGRSFGSAVGHDDLSPVTLA